jgi:predicted ester cyclase
MTQATTTRTAAQTPTQAVLSTEPRVADRVAVALEAVGLVVETHAEARRAGVERVFEPDFRAAGSGRELCPIDAAQALHPADFDAFDDRSIEIVRTVESGDRVLAYVTVRGTHVGTFCGAAGTGRRMRADGLFVLRIPRGRVAEAWSVLRWQ